MMMQTVVLEMVTEVVTVPVRRATRVIVVETVTVRNSSAKMDGTATALGSHGTSTASAGFGTYWPLHMGTRR